MVLCDADETGADVDIISNAITSLSFLNFLPSRKVSEGPTSPESQCDRAGTIVSDRKPRRGEFLVALGDVSRFNFLNRISIF